MSLELTTKSTDEQIQRAASAKIDLVNAGVKLIPAGDVNFEVLENFPLVKNILPSTGKGKLITLLSILINNFCSSFQVVRNMTEDMALEAAANLLNECLDFTIEDYVIMFTLAKRRKIGNILDHIDIGVIFEIYHEYLRMRQSAFKIINQKKGEEKWRKQIEEYNNYSPEQKQACEKLVLEMKGMAQSMVDKTKKTYEQQKKEEDAKYQKYLAAQLEAKKNAEKRNKKAKIEQQVPDREISNVPGGETRLPYKE